MKKILAISSLLFSLYSHAQTDKARIDSIKALMKREQYLSAYKMMQTVQSDGQELIPLAVMLVTSHSIGHNDLYDKWGFKDVNPSGQEAKESVEFPVERLLAYGIQQFPKDCAMYFSSARFYSWMINQEKRYMSLESLREIRDYFVQKTPADCHDEGYYYVVGYANSYLGKPAEAAQQLRQAVSLNPQMTTGWIELANAYVQLKDPAKAIEAGKTVWGMTKDRGLLSQASRIMGEAYELQNDNANALFRYSQADTLHRVEFFNQLSLLKFMVKTNNTGAPNALKAFIGGQGRESLHMYADAYEVYKQYNKLSELAVFCEKYMQDWKERPNIVACTSFTLGMIYKDTNPARAKEYFRKAKELGISASRYSPTRNHPSTEKMVEEAFRLIN
ncbi:tetratricopeptide repeat protein [Terrimonas sp. NA20]|uniref:Tetratricopeptide repeat protein n=1 Tax=Terrimonas ginsenosidimutans TaxID=2908004 RepID=A0ABS9KK68_9BACT|nr:tetratricopeptide repeat protein [Terrimonas ginsenosidimutans]MCG2612716.1 tetratricopeptide repeat protein [Terrimonas ginsenosidimutans]